MFNIHKITLVNFRTYKGTHVFNFPQQGGLFYLTGSNLLEPALGSNGSGKSTFLDAITWVLYGRTTRGLKASDILSWHVETGAQVIIELTVGKARHVIKRTQKPNNLFIDDKPVDQKELETFIRLNYTAFTHSIMNPQFGEPFFSRSAAEKLTLFSDFMGLDYWLIKSEEAAKLARQQEATLTGLRNTITRTEGQLSVIEDDIKSLKQQEAAFEAERALKVEGMEAEVLKAYKANKKANGSIATLGVDKAEAEIDLVHEQAKMDAAEKQREEVLALITAKSRQKVKAIDAIKALKARISNFNCLKGEMCPCCEQKVDERHARRVLDALRDDLDGQEAYLEGYTTALADLNMVLVKHKGHCESAANTVKEIKDEIVSLTVKLNDQKNKSDFNRRHLGDLGASLEALKVGKNPYTSSLVDKRSKYDNLHKQHKADKNSESLLESSLQAITFWIKGFKRIRLFIIEQAFQTLELEVNNCLAQLGMTDWQVTFDVERENKSGGVTKGFVVLIQGPSNKAPVKWENWSGGETQRLQLAGDLGLSNLILQQAGLRSEIQFLDEPSTHLSPEGMLDLADTLHDRAISEGKRIWIADHAAIANYGSFEGIITVRKDSNGSSIALK